MTPLGVARIEAELGVAEPEAYARYCDGEEVYWCAAFVLWCWRQSTAPDLPGNRWRNRAVWHLQHELERAGARVEWPRPGDVVVMRRRSAHDARGVLRARSPGHIGIVDAHTPDGLRTIEGNVSDAVRVVVHAYPPRDVLACYRWPSETKSLMREGKT